jgi:chorismate dehydratase
MAFRARLGRIQYLNVLPIYFALEHLMGENGFNLVPGTPAELNAYLRAGDLDVSSVSSLEFGRFPQAYLLLPDLSISSRGPVGSVILFSRVPPSDLDGRPLLISAASASGAALLKVLMAELFGVRPLYRQGPLTEEGTAGCAALLAIGDEALRLTVTGNWPYQLDLGAAWEELTGLPFVFGVWAVRREFALAHPGAVAGLHRRLLTSRDWGLGALPELSRIAGAHFGLTPSQVLAYFQQLYFSLGPEQEQGLTAFFQYLHNMGELEETPALQYFS